MWRRSSSDSPASFKHLLRVAARQYHRRVGVASPDRDAQIDAAHPERHNDVAHDDVNTQALVVELIEQAQGREFDSERTRQPHPCATRTTSRVRSMNLETGPLAVLTTENLSILLNPVSPGRRAPCKRPSQEV